MLDPQSLPAGDPLGPPPASPAALGTALEGVATRLGEIFPADEFGGRAAGPCRFRGQATDPARPARVGQSARSRAFSAVRARPAGPRALA